MSGQSGVQGKEAALLLSFRERFTASPQFLKLFREGMTLVEETADYLDGPGRAESKQLTPPASQAFTTESMQLTTRLMQLASWLLLRRAVANGELTVADAHNHKRRVRLLPQSTGQAEGFADLPEKFKNLITSSNRLYDRVLRLDRILSDGVSGQPPEETSPVGHQIERIRLAFPAA